MNESIDSSPYFAAIDLGSNSFHMLVVKVNGQGRLETIDRVKEMVQIAQGLSKKGNLSEDAKARALHCLACFSERLRNIPKSQVRVVGTKALRSAHNAKTFLLEAETALGHPINIISGYEEARLVYMGAAPDISADKGRRFIIDIGGGSTEFVIGHDQEPDLLESLSIGCVTYTDSFFNEAATKDREDLTENLQEAYLATCGELEVISQSYCKHGWDIAVGTSGTMKTIAAMMPENDAGIITRKGLQSLMEAAKKPGKLDIKDASSQRRSVLPAGIAILTGIFDAFDLNEIHVLKSTLKEGLIYDTIGRLSQKDPRDGTVKSLINQYRVDVDQAWRVSGTLAHFCDAIRTPIINGIAVDKLLHWAALLHEIGLGISHSGYHHHSHYLLKYSDLAGFGRLEQEILALLVGSHRRKIRAERLASFSEKQQRKLFPLLICLRLAVILNHGRQDLQEWPELTIKDDNVDLVFSKDWLAQHPLTVRHLKKERGYLASFDRQLNYQ